MGRVRSRGLLTNARLTAYWKKHCGRFSAERQVKLSRELCFKLYPCLRKAVSMKSEPVRQPISPDDTSFSQEALSVGIVEIELTGLAIMRPRRTLSLASRPVRSFFRQLT